MRNRDLGSLAGQSALTLAVGAAAIVALFIAGPLGARTGALPTGNLVVNPGAEDSPGATDAFLLLAPVGWATTGAFSVWAYPVRETDWPTQAFAATIGGGANFFSGGRGGVAGQPTASQRIDVSGAAAEIDASAVGATLSAFIGGYSVAEDLATVSARFLDASGAALGSVVVGPVNRDARNRLTVLLKRSAQANVPKGTRSIDVVIAVTPDGQGANHAYADNVSLTLGKAIAPPTPAKPTLTVRCSGKTLVATVQPAKGATVTSVVFLVNGKTVATDRKAPFTSPIGTFGLKPPLRLTARVTQAGKILTLTKAIRRC